MQLFNSNFKDVDFYNIRLDYLAIPNHLYNVPIIDLVCLTCL